MLVPFVDSLLYYIRRLWAARRWTPELPRQALKTLAVALATT